MRVLISTPLDTRPYLQYAVVKISRAAWVNVRLEQDVVAFYWMIINERNEQTDQAFELRIWVVFTSCHMYQADSDRSFIPPGSMKCNIGVVDELVDLSVVIDEVVVGDPE